MEPNYDNEATEPIKSPTKGLNMTEGELMEAAVALWNAPTVASSTDNQMNAFYKIAVAYEALTGRDVRTAFQFPKK